MAGHYIRTKEIRDKISKGMTAYFDDPKKRQEHGDRLKALGIKPPSRKGIHWNEEQKKEISKRNKGMKTHEWTEESRKKASESAKKRKASVETRKKMSEAHKGSKGSNWRGGVTPEHKQIRRSLEYRLWREAVFKRDNWTCQECEARSKKGKRIELHPHHIKSFALYPKLRFKVSNGKTLCVECHEETDNYKKR